MSQCKLLGPAAGRSLIPLTLTQNTMLYHCTFTRSHKRHGLTLHEIHHGVRNCPVVLCGDFNINLRNGLEDEDGVQEGPLLTPFDYIHIYIIYVYCIVVYVCVYIYTHIYIYIYLKSYIYIYVSSITLDISMKYTTLNVAILRYVILFQPTDTCGLGACPSKEMLDLE